jgi:hypothetical protein
MKSMAASPYGFWTSPITSDLVVADSIRLEQVALDGDAIYWSETQPQKQGRTFVYRIGADGEPERVTPDDANAFSIRTRAHEYGGGSFAVSDGVIYFSNNIDQRLYRQDAGRPPSPITPQFMLIGGDTAVGHFFYDHQEPITERTSHRAYPGCYALSKVLEEVMLSQFAIQYGINTCCLRAPWIMEKDDFRYSLSFGDDLFGGPVWNSLVALEVAKRREQCPCSATPAAIR